MPATVCDLLLTRRGVVFVESSGKPLADAQLRAVQLELAAVGYLMSARLEARLRVASLDEVIAFRTWALARLLAHAGGERKHEPLFRSFPAGVPADTEALWWNRVLVFFLQAEDQPCLLCRQSGTTHVLAPCRHVVCDRCFDGATYSACPVCQHAVDRRSPFFQPSPERPLPTERVTFKLLDLGDDVTAQAKALFVSLCERKQALSPVDRDALAVVLAEHGTGVLAWLPASIPVRENVAIVFGTLFRACDPAEVLPAARRFMTTATDVLRFLAVLSGADGSLLPETRLRRVEVRTAPGTLLARIARLLGKTAVPGQRWVDLPERVYRFKMAKLPRGLRRALFAVLEGMDPERLVEDMLRHRSFWVWVGEFLHPHEYAARFPSLARAFHIVRGKAPDGTPAPDFQGFHSRVERAVRGRDADAMASVLAERPGELARRFDHLVRVAGADPAAVGRAVSAFTGRVPAFATPVLVTLRSHLPLRDRVAPVRVYWPKARVAMGVSAPDQRAVLPRAAIEPALAAIDAELLARFARKPGFACAVIDEALRTVMVPFNERTASPAAVSVPRGSRLAVPTGKLMRLFLHWCQPKDGDSSDLDLSIGFYDATWRHVGVCAFYHLQLTSAGGALIAQSGGDRQNAPWPDGASELVDLHREAALADGVRYAVMVVNNYAGPPFSELERGYAGLMLRDDVGGQHFDPRTVEHKFALDGGNGVFLPLVLDVRDGVLHWLDVQSKGELDMNTVATSNQAITKICPELMGYFASGTRASMLDLALLHAAARCQRVLLRGPGGVAEFSRRPGETAQGFHTRLVAGVADEPRSRLPAAGGAALLAVLLRGDVALPEGSLVYALFRERVAPSLAASDLLS